MSSHIMTNVAESHKLIHQQVYACVDLDNQILRGETTLTFLATSDVIALPEEPPSSSSFPSSPSSPSTSVPLVRLNCRDQLAIASTHVNDTPAEWVHADPLVTIVSPDAESRDAFAFVDELHAHSEAAQLGGLVISIPAAVLPLASGQEYTVRVAFALVAPRVADTEVDELSGPSLCGVTFVGKQGGGPQPTLADVPPHMFTHGFGGDACAWFPCRDDPAVRCTWDIYLAVQPGLTAVGCGVLYKQGPTPDKRHVVFHYKVEQYTPAAFIGCAVGPFELVSTGGGGGGGGGGSGSGSGSGSGGAGGGGGSSAVSSSNELPLMAYVLPGLEHLVESTVATYSTCVSTVNSVLTGARDRFHDIVPKHHIVFVAEAYSPLQSYATLSIMDTSLLVSPRVIEPTLKTRAVLMESVARQLFTHLVTPPQLQDVWLQEGLVGWLCHEFDIATLGVNEARWLASERLRRVCERDHNQLPLWTDERNHAVEYASEFVRDKATLVLCLIQHSVGLDHLREVLSVIITRAVAAAKDGDAGSLLSTRDFFDIIQQDTNQDLHHVFDTYVRNPGVARLHCKWNYRHNKGHGEGGRGMRLFHLEITQPEGQAVFIDQLTVSSNAS